jgi:pyridoxal phosphate enzyme (YggS family)
MGETIRDRLEHVRARIAKAAVSAGRDPADVTLIAVSKRKPASDIVAAYEAGQRHFGENYIQEFQSKKAELPELPGAVFHFIGKLQSNKTRLACELFDTIHTVSSVKLARRLNEQTTSVRDVFIEVKLSDEDTKGGLNPAQVSEVAAFIRSSDQLNLCGLMTMPPLTDDAATAQPYFRQLRQLADANDMNGLSMGMSRDLEVAISEGATFVRVGTAIFGEREPVG